jgi:hypothetical protein
MNENRLDYAISILTDQLQKDCGQYVAQEMLKKSTETDDTAAVMATLIGNLMEDSSLHPHVKDLSDAVQLLRVFQKRWQEEENNATSAKNKKQK